MAKTKHSSKMRPVSMEEDGGRLLTVPEVSEYLRIGPESIRRWLREGKLAGINLGRGSGWRIRRADLAQLISDRHTATRTSPNGNAPSSNGRATPLGGPIAVQVLCVTKESLQNPHTGVTYLGTTDRRWSRDEVMAAIEAGTHSFYTESDGSRAEIAIYPGPFSRYIRTREDGRWTDGLLKLKDCPI